MHGPNIGQFSLVRLVKLIDFVFLDITYLQQKITFVVTRGPMV